MAQQEKREPDSALNQRVAAMVDGLADRFGQEELRNDPTARATAYAVTWLLLTHLLTDQEIWLIISKSGTSWDGLAKALRSYLDCCAFSNRADKIELLVNGREINAIAVAKIADYGVGRKKLVVRACTAEPVHTRSSLTRFTQN